MGREVRRVPPDWQHPTDDEGYYIPLFPGSRLAKWDTGYAKWQEGYRSDYCGGWIRHEYGDMTYETYAGDRPKPEDCMPAWTADEATHYMMYEDCTEGTPLSPAFATPEELARWLADNAASAFGDMTATYEQWLRVCRGSSAPSAVMHDGTITSGVEAMGEVDDA